MSPYVKIGMIYLLIFTSLFCQAEQSKPLWEYGFGIAHLRFEQYPSSDQYSSLNIPFPTFQYRGEVFRADDQEGARAYLVKEAFYSLEFTGGGTPPVKSDNNTARQGMSNIPLIAMLGPQLVVKIIPGLEFKLSALQAISTDFQMTRFAGQVYESKFDFRYNTETRHSGRLQLTLSNASKEFLSHFYEVEAHQTTADRQIYSTKPGYYATELSYFHSIDFEKLTYYIGTTLNNYSNSSNRESPLFKTSQSINYLIGFTYLLGESERRAVPEDAGDGLFEKIRRRTHPL